MVLLHPTASAIVKNVERVLLGKTEPIKLCVAVLLSDGHVLIEDMPGVGKTVLARSLAISIGATYTRVQFTPDLLPGDITGVQIYNQDTRQFDFRPGPIMTQVLLADEINRATPRTQSALLEGMDERRLTLDGVTYPLPEPFIVLATQNPLEFEGTYPLPESQLDRFLISLRLGYPDRQNELSMLSLQEDGHPLETLASVATIGELRGLQQAAREIYVDDLIRQYILDIVEATRSRPDIRLGASPRATLALFRLAQSWALLHGRDYVLPDDVKAVAGAVLRRRIIPAGYIEGLDDLDRFVNTLIQSVPVPGNRG
ncbi:MAG TPA: AAA family ATPase [Chloroflexota bacterium]